MSFKLSLFAAAASVALLWSEADGSINIAKGARGGQAAACSQQHVLGSNGERVALPQYCDTWINSGETLISIASGGGGYGRPELRDPLKVLEDVSERLISRERAREVYRVAITSDLTVDQSATAALRSQYC